MDRKLTKNIIYKFLLNIFNLVVPLLIGPYIMRVLNPDQIGQLNFAQSIIGYFFIFASFGVYQYGLREISRARSDKKKLIGIFSNLFIITIISNLICLILYLIVVLNFYRDSDIYWILIILSTNFISNAFYVEWVNEATEHFDFITKKSIIVRLLYVICIFVFVKSSRNFNDYLYLIIGSTFLNNIISYIYVKNKYKFDFRNIKIKKHLRPMLYVVILTNAGVLYTQMDRFMLGEFVNNIEVAFYSTSQNIMRVINILLLTLIEATIPRLSMYAITDSKQYNKLLNNIVKSYFIILFPAAFGLMFLSKEIIYIYAGSEYINSYHTLAIFAIYMISIGYENIISNQIMYINGKEKIQIKINFLGGVFNIILNFIFIKFNIFDASTAIFTTLLCNVLILMIQYLYIIKFIPNVDFKFIDKDIILYIVFSLLFYPIIKVVNLLFNSYISIAIISIVICSLVYLILLLLKKDKVVLNMLSFVKSKIRLKR